MNIKSDSTLMHEWNNQTKSELDTFTLSESYFNNGLGTTISKLENFPKYVRRQTLSKFLARAEIFRKVLGIHGSIIDCGVNAGSSLMTFAHLSSIFEPVNYTRKVIGFDTFQGIAGVTEMDLGKNTSSHVREGGFAADGYFDDLKEAEKIFDGNRVLGHIPKIELVRGDIRLTLPMYLEANRHLVVSLLHLDMDIYEPTKLALEVLKPRMPKGAIIVFDELNQPGYPGETQAVVDSIGIANLKLERIGFETGISFAVLN